MIDPLTSLGLASNIVQLVDFGSRVIKSGSELAKTGTTAEHEHLGLIAQDTSDICSELNKQIKLEDVTHEHNKDGECQRKIKTLRTSDPGREGHPDPEKAIGVLACRTKDIADDLTDLLYSFKLSEYDDIDKSPAKKQRLSSGKVIRKVLRSTWNNSEVTRLQKQMTELQQDLILRLSLQQTTTLSKLVASLDPQMRSSDDSTGRRLDNYARLLPLIPKHVEAVSDRNISDFDGKAKQFEACLDTYMEQVRSVLACQRTLKSLVFEEIRSREESIVEAHVKTFSWIYSTEKCDFGDWLMTRRGPYWITGKPGCGKSTLMKYIVHNPRTVELLRTWAGSEDLMIASHYFWNAGTSLQKSQVGLLRTLLYHIVLQSPALAKELIPKRFKEPCLESVEPWTYAELCATIKSFVHKISRGSKLCLFIDGLDEYVGEHEDLVELISSISATPQVKVCVSTRPWNVFTKVYHKRADGQLELQHFTRTDIRAYVEDRLTSDPLFRELEDRELRSNSELIDAITEKAEGVFLWVYLVVRSLRRGLTNDDDFAILMRRIEAYPQTLNGYYHRMLSRIEDVYRQPSARLMLAAIFAESTLPFWAARCIELEISSPHYAVAVGVPPTQADASVVFGCNCHGIWSQLRKQVCQGSDLDDDDDELHSCFFVLGKASLHTAAQKKRLNGQLDARTADILEVVSEGNAFVHRTARDFLAHSDISVRLYQEAGTDYDVGLSLARIDLVTAKRLGDIAMFSSETLMSNKLASFNSLVRPENLAAYAGLFDDLERKHEVLIKTHNLPPVARPLSIRDNVVEENALLKRSGTSLHRTTLKWNSLLK